MDASVLIVCPQNTCEPADLSFHDCHSGDGVEKKQNGAPEATAIRRNETSATQLIVTWEQTLVPDGNNGQAREVGSHAEDGTNIAQKRVIWADPYPSSGRRYYGLRFIT